jgi:DNA-binding NarL/FixJ family response regulator
MNTIRLSSKLNALGPVLTVNPSLAPDNLQQTQWIGASTCVNIISYSYLLREAIFRLLNSDFRADSDHLRQNWVLLDYGIGLDLLITTIQDWKVKDSESYLIVLELPCDSDVILDCMEAGAHAYILQGACGDQIIAAMQQVSCGLFQYPPQIITKLLERLAQIKATSLQPSHPLSSLTQREQEVMSYLIQGYSDQAIAAELIVAVRTVKHHVHNLLRKLNVKYRWQAAQLAIDQGWGVQERSIQDRSNNGSLN